MKAFVPFDIQKTSSDKMRQANLLFLRGTDQRPSPPRSLQCQSGARKVLLTWDLPTKFDDISGWRIYKDTEKNLAMEVRDRGTRQMFMDVSSGATPTVVNFFVSSINPLGIESVKIQVQGSAVAEAGAPPDPEPPPEYTDTRSGGGDTTYRSAIPYSPGMPRRFYE